MADNTPIEWTDATWNPITGCSVVSPGCTNCYAMKLAGTRLKHHPSREGLTRDTKAGPVWNGEVRFNREWLTQPLQWKRPRMIFVCAHGDLFAEGVPDEWIDQVFAVMALAPHHTFQVLTKRPERMREYFRDISSRSEAINRQMNEIAPQHWCKRELEDYSPDGLPLPNVWLGVSVEDQPRADERIPILLETPAAIRWISAEPLLGLIDLNIAWYGENSLDSECWGDCSWRKNDKPPLHNCQRGQQFDKDLFKGRSGLDWVVAGGESGPNARPMHPDWARLLRDQCAAADVPFLFKQFGGWCPATTDYGVSGHCMPDTGEKFTWIGADGRTANPSAHGLKAPVMAIAKMGKKAAGRLLDGVEHNGFPEKHAARLQMFESGAA